MVERHTQAPKLRQHPRSVLVREASNDIFAAIIDALSRHKLTPAEEFYVLNDAPRRLIASLANSCMTAEREETDAR